MLFEKQQYQEDCVQNIVNILSNVDVFQDDYRKFAYFIEGKGEKKLFLIVETKEYENINNISDSEKNNIEYDKVFFSKLQKELPNIDIHY